MATNVTITAAEKRALLLEAMEFRIRYLLGRLLFPCRGFLKGEWFQLLFTRVKRFDGIFAKSDYERLPSGLLDELLKIQHDQVDRSAEHRAKTYSLNDQTVNSTNNDYAFVAREAAKLLDRFPGLRSVANIGARVDVVTDFLSAKYPERTFSSIDLQSNLAEHNRFFPERSNWQMKSGYIIDMLEKGHPAPDLAIMMFTSCKFAQRELERFLQLSKNLKAILILATYKPNPNSVLKFGLDLPDRLTKSYLTSPTLLDPNIPSYVFVHNYEKILTDNDFQVGNATIRKSPNTILHGASIFITGTRDLT